ncbi:MAG: SorC family transcriptional regulator, partial [Enterococcus sp.]
MGRNRSTMDIKRPMLKRRVIMLDDLKLIEAVAPDILHVLQERYKILRNIYWMQPIGRRNLAESLHMTERVLRTETDLLKRLALIDVTKSGMSLTKTGEKVFTDLGKVMDQLFGVHQLEKHLANHFGIARCVISAGDSDRQEKVVKNFGESLNESLDLL